MGRLTWRDKNGKAWFKPLDPDCGGCEFTGEQCKHHVDIAADRLAAYEETGLEPEEIVSGLRTIRQALALACEIQVYHDIGTHDHLKELVQAEKAGRLVNYLPGDTVYDRFGVGWTVTTSEIHKFDDGTLRYLYRCGHPGTDDYRALYADEILTRAEAEAVLQKESRPG